MKNPKPAPPARPTVFVPREAVAAIEAKYSGFSNDFNVKISDHPGKLLIISNNELTKL